MRRGVARGHAGRKLAERRSRGLGGFRGLGPRADTASHGAVGCKPTSMVIRYGSPGGNGRCRVGGSRWTIVVPSPVVTMARDPGDPSRQTLGMRRGMVKAAGG